MAKLPFLKWVPGDYLLGTRSLTDTEKAIWVDLLCFMWLKPDERGFLLMEIDDICRMLGRDRITVTTTLLALKNKGIADIQSRQNGANIEYHIVSRRMVRDAKDLEDNAKRQEAHRKSGKLSNGVSNAFSNAKVTPKKSEVRRQKTDKDKDYSAFDRFYEAYPRKVARAAALKAWKAASPDPALVGRILASVAAWAKTDQWSNPQYIPHPATYLNQKRWEDEIPTNKEASYESIKAKLREDDERVKRILAGTGSGNGIGKVIRPARPKLVKREESDLDPGIDFESAPDESDPPGHSLDQGG